MNEETKLNEKQYVKKQKRKKIVIIAIVIIIVMILFFSVIFALVNMNNDKIISGIKINGFEVSGLTIDEAKTKIKLAFEEKNKKSIILKNGDYETEIIPESLEINYDIEKSIKEAISYGKNGNIFENNYKILFTLIGKKDIKMDLSLNEDILKNKIQEIQSNLPDSVEESSYYIEDETLIITKGKEGKKIDEDDLKEKIKNSLLSLSINNEIIEIKTYNKKPDEIDIEKIHNEIYREKQDAYYTIEPFEIFPEVDGVDFDIEEAKNILKEQKDIYEIPLSITKAEYTTADIGTEAFPDIIGKFSTRYDASDTDRTTNLIIACAKLNDKVILPGETFSYNKTLGERTRAAGYKEAKVYENGQVVDGLGGGICQISSTLYNAVLDADMEIIERRNHQFVTSYVPAGKDATVVYGLTDFKFKNNRKYAIKLKASCSGGVATITIYGIKQDDDCIVSLTTNTVSTIPYTIKYIEDSSLQDGQEIVTQKGANGLVVETYITKTLNGNVISKKLLSKDTYTPMQRIIKIGEEAPRSNEAETVPATTEPEKEQEQETSEQPEPEQENDKPQEQENAIQNIDNKNEV